MVANGLRSPKVIHSEDRNEVKDSRQWYNNVEDQTEQSGMQNNYQGWKRGAHPVYIFA